MYTQPYSNSTSALTVSGVNNYIKSILSADKNLSGIFVRGELSNYKLYQSGHAYFSLKDTSGVLKCVMFSTYTSRLSFIPQNGMNVVAYGSVNVYERDGVYQLYVQSMLPDGIGALYAAFEELKKKLYSEGLFDGSKKRKIKYLPKCVGVITSIKGAVLHDIQNVIYRRFPNMNITVYDVSVQGSEASGQIESAFKYFNTHDIADTLILARGGGSIEDLWAFNEARTAYAIASSRVPVISAVGHETDYTIADYTADLRAPTPSAAAELAVPEYTSISAMMKSYSEKIRTLPLTNLTVKRRELEKVSERAVLSRFSDRVNNCMQYTDDTKDKLCRTLQREIDKATKQIMYLEQRNENVSPLTILSRGYSILLDKDNDIVKKISDAENGDILRAVVSDGSMNVKVIKNE